MSEEKDNRKIIVLDENSSSLFEKKMNDLIEKGFIPKAETFRHNLIENYETFSILLVKQQQGKFDINKLLWG